MEQQGQSSIPGLRLTEVLDRKRSEVWRAVDLANGHQVAVKLLIAAYEPIVPRRYGRRNRALTKVLTTTPGWVPLLDTGTARDGRQFVTMPYYAAGSLGDRLARGATPWREATKMVGGLATILGGAHHLGWPFGNLRPTNVLLADGGQPLVSVYGSASRRFDDGTAQFTAPEAAVDGGLLPASDVFSLSLILASLIAGREVDHSERASDIVSEIEGVTPGPILEIIDYGLSPQLQNRFADAAKMARAISAVLDDPGQGLESETPTDYSDRTAGRETEVETRLAGPLVRAPRAATEVDPQPVAMADAALLSFAAGFTTDPDTEPPSVGLDEDTAPVGFAARPDDPAAIAFPTSDGPLSDLLEPGPNGSAPTARSVQSDRSRERQQNHRTRAENDELITKIGLEPAPSRSSSPEGPRTGSTHRASDGRDGQPPPAGGGSGSGFGDDDGGGADHGLESGPNAEVHSDAGQRQGGDEGIDGPVARTAFVPEWRTVGRPRTAGLATGLLQYLLIHRRRFASSAAILGLTAVLAITLVAAVQAVRSNNVEASEGSPTDDLVPEEGGSDGSDDVRSPLNDLDHLDDAVAVEVQITAAPSRGRVPSDLTTDTSTGVGDEPSTSTVEDDPVGGDSTTTVPEPFDETGGRGRPTTTSDNTSTSGGSSETTATTLVTASSNQTTTTESATTTTKRRGRPRP